MVWKWLCLISLGVNVYLYYDPTPPLILPMEIVKYKDKICPTIDMGKTQMPGMRRMSDIQ